MSLRLKQGKFYDDAGNVVPLEFGNKEQIALLNLASALNGDGVCMSPSINGNGHTEFLFQCICGAIHSPKIKSKFKCECGHWYTCFDTYYLPAVKFAK